MDSGIEVLDIMDSVEVLDIMDSVWTPVDVVFAHEMNLVLSFPLFSFNISCTGIEGEDWRSNHESLCYCTHTLSEENSQDAFELNHKMLVE